MKIPYVRSLYCAYYPKSNGPVIHIQQFISSAKRADYVVSTNKFSPKLTSRQVGNEEDKLKALPSWITMA